MSRTFTIKELNEKIDNLISGYVEDLRETTSDQQNKIIEGKIEALQDLKMELHDPQAIVSPDWANKIQESLNIIETNKIIKDGL